MRCPHGHPPREGEELRTARSAVPELAVVTHCRQGPQVPSTGDVRPCQPVGVAAMLEA